MVFLEVLLENPFIFSFLFIVLASCLIFFIFLSNQNESNDEAILFSSFGRPIIGLIFIFFSIASLIYFFTKVSSKLASEESFLTGLGVKPFNQNLKKSEDLSGVKLDKIEYEPVRLGGQVIHKAGWIENPNSQLNSQKDNQKKIDEEVDKKSDSEFDEEGYNSNNYPSIVALNI